MKEFLLEIWIGHGDRSFGYQQYLEEVQLFVDARDGGYIDYMSREKYTSEHLPYKLTPKALAYIKEAE